MGITRLSLGVENFDDRILELNGRAHRSPEIGQAYRAARALDFPQINIDLIAGMLGETEENWRVCVQKTLELEPDSVTVYQMELPYNTTISRDLLKGTKLFAEPVVNWTTKRRWVAEAVRLPRPPLAGCRHGGDRRRVVRPHQRRAHPESGHMGNLQRRDRSRRHPAAPRLSPDRRGAHDSRAGAAAQAGERAPGVLRGQVRRRPPRAIPRRARFAHQRGVHHGGKQAE